MEADRRSENVVLDPLALIWVALAAYNKEQTASQEGPPTGPVHIARPNWRSDQSTNALFVMIEPVSLNPTAEFVDWTLDPSEMFAKAVQYITSEPAFSGHQFVPSFTKKNSRFSYQSFCFGERRPALAH